MGEETVSKEFDDCLKNRRITEFERAKSLVSKELDQAKVDLETAKDSHKNTSYKWAIIQSYYSMFHSARALIYSKGYRERSHYCLIVAMRELFASKKLISSQLIEALQLGKTLRENADYYGEFSEEAAKQMIENAEDFLIVANDLTKN